MSKIFYASKEFNLLNAYAESSLATRRGIVQYPDLLDAAIGRIGMGISEFSDAMTSLTTMGVMRTIERFGGQSSMIIVGDTTKSSVDLLPDEHDRLRHVYDILLEHTFLTESELSNMIGTWRETDLHCILLVLEVLCLTKPVQHKGKDGWLVLRN